jgi:hypothetical protein
MRSCARLPSATYSRMRSDATPAINRSATFVGVRLFVTREGSSTVEPRAANLPAINAAAAASPVLVQEGIEQDPVAFPNGITRAHVSFITRNLYLIKVSRPVAWLSQLWLLRRWEIILGLCPRITSPKQTNAGNDQNRQ